METNSSIFEPGFLYFLRISVDLHHQLYPAVPQGIYFEALVERTFREINKPMTVIKVGGTTQPRYSLKTETGKGTKPGSITIMKPTPRKRNRRFVVF